jgi:hypothetical protein
MKHKWHKEIHAWADGAEIEFKLSDDWHNWMYGFEPLWDIDEYQYRIKPQPKEDEIEKEWNRRMAEKALAIPEISEAVYKVFEAFAVKEPQYLYAYDTEEGIKLGEEGSATPIKNLNGRYKLLGAIKMEEQS